MRTLRDVYGREIPDGAKVRIRDHIPEINEYIRSEGIMIYKDNKCYVNDREVFVIDEILLLEPKPIGYDPGHKF